VLELTPEDFDVESHPVSDIIGGQPADNFRILQDLLEGRTSQSIEDCVLMNASALLFVANRVKDFGEGTALARESLKGGFARKVLERYIRYSQSLL
jgi:anthranilate phosphoribosyltransferase